MNSCRRGWPKAPATRISRPGLARRIEQQRGGVAAVRQDVDLGLDAAGGVVGLQPGRIEAARTGLGRGQDHHLGWPFPAAAGPARGRAAGLLAAVPGHRHRRRPTFRPSRAISTGRCSSATICWKASARGPRPRAGIGGEHHHVGEPALRRQPRPDRRLQGDEAALGVAAAVHGGAGVLLAGLGGLLQRLQGGGLHAAHEALAHPGHHVGHVGRGVDARHLGLERLGQHDGGRHAPRRRPARPTAAP